MTHKSVAVVACFRNRRSLTERMVRGLSTQGGSAFSVRFFLMDDGSDDGTAECIAALKVDAEIIVGDGSHYWAGGMVLAIKSALATNPDLVLLVNDDVDFAEDSLARLVSCLGSLPLEPPSIVVGSTCDEELTETTYGGFAVEPGVGVRLRRVEPMLDRTVPIDTFNANCVLIRGRLLRELGGISVGYTHALADIDLGLRAKARGIHMVLAPGYFGVCASHQRDLANANGLLELVRTIRHPKGLPPLPWALFNRRHGGPFWPIAFTGAYLKIMYRYFAMKVANRT